MVVALFYSSGVFAGSEASFSHQVFEFDEGLLVRIEVWAVWRRNRRCARSLEWPRATASSVAAQIVEHDSGALCEVVTSTFST